MPPPTELPPWLLCSIITLLTGLLGWVSHWLAVCMSFSPLSYKGVGVIGWQGIIPKKAGEISSAITKDLVQQFGNVGQIFEYLGPEKVVNHITNALRPQLDTIVDDVMYKKHMVLWENLPISLKNRIYARMHRMLPRVIDDIVEDIGDQILWIVQLEHLIGKQFEEKPEQLVALFRNCSQDTLVKAAWFSAISCSVLSWIPLSLWFYLETWWVLPLGLAALMILSSWVALSWLWKYNYQRHRSQILDTFVDILSEEILTTQNLFQEVFNGPKAKHAHVLIKKHVNRIVDHNVIRSFVQLTAGLEGFADIKQTLSEEIADVLLVPLGDARFNQGNADTLKTLFNKNRNQLDNQRFQTLFWPIIEAERVPLLTLSALFGLASGCLPILLTLI